MRESLEGFKQDLLKWLAICNDPTRDVYVKLAAFIGVLRTFDKFAEVWDREVHDQLAPVLGQYGKEMGNLILGRHSKTFTPAPRRGKRPPLIRDVQEGLRVAAAMHFLVPTLGKDGASKQVARWMVLSGVDARSVNYWRDQGMNGSPEYRALFEEICRSWTDKIPDPQRRAKALIKVHKKRPVG